MTSNNNIVDTVNGRFAVFCKPDSLAIVKLRIEAKDHKGQPVAIERDLSYEVAKRIYFEHAHTCKDRDNLWIWYLTPGQEGTWKPVKRGGPNGDELTV